MILQDFLINPSMKLYNLVLHIIKSKKDVLLVIKWKFKKFPGRKNVAINASVIPTALSTIKVTATPLRPQSYG